MLPAVAILAGGLATRLYPLTERVPKALVDVNGEPFVVHQLNLLRREGVRRVVLCAGYLGELIRGALGDGSRYGMDVTYSFDGETLLGTAGALKKALPLLGETFFVLYGDSYLRVPYGAVYERFTASGLPALVTVFRNDGHWDTSNVLYRDGKIVRYDKHSPTPDMHHIDYGLAVLHAHALDAVAPDVPADLGDLYHALARDGRMAAYEATNRFYEIGSPAGLAALRQLLTEAAHE
jgi:NDP-sugar pyrophosphorylase family protein